MILRLVVRYLAILSLGVWLGGFTFYSASVVKIMHEHLDSMDAGSITQEVTDVLNLVGAASLVLLWSESLVGRSDRSKRGRRIQFGLLLLSTFCLIFLFVWHEYLDRRLELNGLTGFYPLHEVYLIAHTVLWVLQLGLLSTLIPVPVSSGKRSSDEAASSAEPPAIERAG